MFDSVPSFQTEIRRTTPWTGERIARFGFLMGLGWDAERISKDRIIASTPNNIHKQAHRFGLAFRVAAAMSWPLPLKAAIPFETAASKRRITREALIRQLLLVIASEPNLIENILDDGV